MECPAYLHEHDAEVSVLVCNIDAVIGIPSIPFRPYQPILKYLWFRMALPHGDAELMQEKKYLTLYS